MAKKKKLPGKAVADKNVFMVWKCGVCGQDAIVSPTFYADAGIPICTNTSECEGTDMDYVETRIVGPDKAKAPPTPK